MKRVSLELGGKSPVIVFEDADIDLAVETTHDGVFYNAGQSCDACSRIFVHESVHEEFLKKAVEKAKSRCSFTKAPWEDDTLQGAIIDKDQHEKILNLIQSGINEGAQLECGGKPIRGPGYFIEPTVFSGVEDWMKIAKEEIFGPVMQILKFNDFEEVMERANDTDYGLSSGVFTKSLDTANKAIQYLQAGTVSVNTYGALDPTAPFGGFKMSGHGRDFSEYSLQLYTEVKTVTIAMPVKNS